MLVGFEDITVELNASEKELAKWIAECFKKRKPGKKNAVTNGKICAAYLNECGEKITGVRIRKVVQYIRTHNLVPRLCSTGTGYFVAATDKEWEDWKTSMKQRIRQTQYTLACAEFFGDGGNEKL